MLTTNDLQSIKELVKGEIDPVKEDVKSVKKDLSSVKNQLDTLEIKVEFVNKRIEQAQDETIDVLSGLINTGFNLHEERIKKIEDKLQIINSPST